MRFNATILHKHYEDELENFMASTNFDYIIVGAGSAGCALAARIADSQPNSTVALIEAGPNNKNFIVEIPIMTALMYAFGNSHNWNYYTVPQSGLNGRCGFQPRGRGLGGSSSINSMIYIRGHYQDYNDWEKLGCSGWAWEDVLPYFKRSENNERGADAWHGTGGPLNVADLSENDRNPFAKTFIEAGKQAGYKFNPDFNGEKQEGVGYYQFTEKEGMRCNTSRAYLLGKNRKNLEIITNGQVLRILFANKKAIGVEFERDGNITNIKANREIILSAGAFGSPQLLMCSGIGPAEHLKSLNIPVLHHSPEVGKNLQDHITYTNLLYINAKDLMGCNFHTLYKLIQGLYQFTRYKRGIYTSTQCEAGAFLKTDPLLERPDIQLHFVHSLVDDHLHVPHVSRGITLRVSLLRPKSRGELLLSSNNPKAPPLIDPNFYGENEDLEVMLKGVAMSHKILNAPAISKFNGKQLYSEGVVGVDALTKIVRDHSDTIYHPVGTCRMGSDETSVLDTHLRVKGVDNLRVIDASIMPTLVGGNTNAPAIMIGEKGADLIIKGK